MKKIELSEDFFAASSAGGSGDRPGEEGTMDILLGRNPSDAGARKSPAQSRRRPTRPATSPPPSGMTGLLSLPFDLTRNLMTVLLHLVRAAIPVPRHR